MPLPVSAVGGPCPDGAYLHVAVDALFSGYMRFSTGIPVDPDTDVCGWVPLGKNASLPFSSFFLIFSTFTLSSWRNSVFFRIVLLLTFIVMFVGRFHPW